MPEPTVSTYLTKNQLAIITADKFPKDVEIVLTRAHDSLVRGTVPAMTELAKCYANRDTWTKPVPNWAPSTALTAIRRIDGAISLAKSTAPVARAV